MKEAAPNTDQCAQGRATIYYEVEKEDILNICNYFWIIRIFRCKKCGASWSDYRLNGVHLGE
ncbi:MAG: hypothetical protein COU81_01215 [Candidatus Portnoybacteria bacterium CG10_big_fil_rev_8_21_14_0_10_36_7]|uniref:Uncharacterized protein n=1 Tax=Candidatus Portnoybacteria bacterium CG10_big_fil_rev_8_21_14_0_10_36_7 TaxID=1974812 RepID=A0A2M8KEJ9_9BACT|nr:MAG: hypothetical protein COU81_01215 [Candidatus Portnoybacteria bacterium CG10_big_fil_rev_8_21_14_0_10_36_7]